MKYINLTLATPEENLACDEALLDLSEDGPGDEILRFWEPDRHFVVLGYSRKSNQDINLESCVQQKIPVLRRVSGGGTVLQGPGCLNYSLILNLQNSRPLKTITDTNRYVLNRHKEALEPIIDKTIEVAGISDLTVENLKFSGNAQRRKKSFLLFHGTFLLNFKIPLIEAVLALPQDQPDYRKNRTHRDFLMNLKLSGDVIKKALLKSWEADQPLNLIPQKKIRQLVEERYSNRSWNFKY